MPAILILLLSLSTKTHLPTPPRRDRIKMKPIFIKGLKQRLSTRTLYGPREVYKVSYESLDGKCQSTRLLTLNSYRSPIERTLVMDMQYNRQAHAEAETSRRPAV